jgi:methyltransferase family protein
MQQPEPRPSQDPQEEIELLREKLRRLEAEHADVQQKLFDQYEWTREKTKAFDKELRSLRSISLEYKLFDFVRQIYQRTTGLPAKTLEEDVEKLTVSLAAIPTKNDPNSDAWLRSLLRQTHANYEITVVIGDSDPEPAQDIKDSANVRIVRTKDEYSDAIRANIGLCFASGDIWGVIAGGYWPYAGSLRNVCTFFAEHDSCQIMLPTDLTIFGDDLIAPTEYARPQDFVDLWKNYSGRHGSLFFRPEAYKKIERINYEAGDAWLFGTLLQLAWHFDVGRSHGFIVVNANRAFGDPARSQIESANGYVRQHFFGWGFFNDYGKPVWYFPIQHSTHLLRGLRIRLERVFRYVRSFAFGLQRAMFSPKSVLQFPVAPDNQFGSRLGAHPDFSNVDICPLTEALPDRFLFSLEALDNGALTDVYYASQSSIAILSRGRSSGERSPDPGTRASNDRVKPTEGGCRFISPAVLVRAERLQPATVEPGRSEDGQSQKLALAYENAIAQILSENVTDALWIGDPEFGPSGSSTIEYGVQRIWQEYPGLGSGDLEALSGSDILAGRNAETGFDLIHLAGILQLCRRPRHLLRFLAFALKFNAPILISTPNLDSNDLKLLGPAWCHWDPQRTCFVYGAQSLRALMRHCGFEEKILVSFSHPSWRTAGRRNLANAIPPVDIPAESGFVEGLSAPSKSKNQAPAPNLEGDFLIGLFNRKL